MNATPVAGFGFCLRSRLSSRFAGGCSPVPLPNLYRADGGDLAAVGVCFVGTDTDTPPSSVTLQK